VDYDDLILAAVLSSAKQLKESINLHDELAAEMTPPSPPVETRMAGPVLGVVGEVIKGIRDGTQMTHVYQDVVRLVSNQESRAELIDQLMLTHDFTRYADFITARDAIESDLLLACKNDKLTPVERITVYREITKIVSVIEARIRGQTSSVKDIISQLQKVDYAVSSNTDAELQKRFAKTSPQAREITRKLLTKLRKAVVQTALDDPATLE
jgi:hypothetical protein